MNQQKPMSIIIREASVRNLYSSCLGSEENNNRGSINQTGQTNLTNSEPTIQAS